MKRKIVSAGIVMILLASVVACGASEPAPAPAPAPAPKPAPAPAPTPAPAPAPKPTPAPASKPAPAIELENEISVQFLSSSTPMTPGEEVVKFLNDLYDQEYPKISATWKWLPLPASVNKIDEMPAEERKYGFAAFLPVTDFLLARAGGGPEKHKYAREYTDLLFVGNVTNGGWTFLTKDPELAADPRKLAGKVVGVINPPEARAWGSPDLLAYSILKDAWGIYDEVDLVKVSLPEVGGLFDAELIDAAFWGMANNMSGTYTIPPPFYDTFKDNQYYWIPLTQADVDKVNAANAWKINLLTVPKDSITIPGPPATTVNPPEDVTMCDFGGAFTAWEDTEEDVVYEMLRFIVTNADKIKEANLRMQVDPEKMAQWPGLTKDMVHPGALRFYETQGIKIGE